MKTVNCKMVVTDLGNGEYKHECLDCGVVRVTNKQRFTRVCGAKTTIEKITDGAQSLANAAVQAIGGSLVSREEYDRRLAICNGAGEVPKCPQEADGRCGVCGCKLKIKAQLDTWHCPIKKW